MEAVSKAGEEVARDPSIVETQRQPQSRLSNDDTDENDNEVRVDESMETIEPTIISAYPVQRVIIYRQQIINDDEQDEFNDDGDYEEERWTVVGREEEEEEEDFKDQRDEFETKRNMFKALVFAKDRMQSEFLNIRTTINFYFGHTIYVDQTQRRMIAGTLEKFKTSIPQLYKQIEEFLPRCEAYNVGLTTCQDEKFVSSHIYPHCLQSSVQLVSLTKQVLDDTFFKRWEKRMELYTAIMNKLFRETDDSAQTILQTIEESIKSTPSETCEIPPEMIFEMLTQLPQLEALIAFDKSEPLEWTTSNSSNEANITSAYKQLWSAMTLLFTSYSYSASTNPPRPVNVSKIKEVISWLKKNCENAELSSEIFSLLLKCIYSLKDVSGDGSCLFRAVILQTDKNNPNDSKANEKDVIQEYSANVSRRRIASRMAKNPAKYCNFVEVNRLAEFLPGADKGNEKILEDTEIRQTTFLEYCKNLDDNRKETKMWGGYVELLALSEEYNRPVYVVRFDDDKLNIDEKGSLCPGDLYSITGSSTEGDTTTTTPSNIIWLYYNIYKQHYSALMNPTPAIPQEQQQQQSDSNNNNSSSNNSNSNNIEQEANKVEEIGDGKDEPKTEKQEVLKEGKEESPQENGKEDEEEVVVKVEKLEKRSNELENTSLSLNEYATEEELREAIVMSIKMEAVCVGDEVKLIEDLVKGKNYEQKIKQRLTNVSSSVYRALDATADKPLPVVVVQRNNSPNINITVNVGHNSSRGGIGQLDLRESLMDVSGKLLAMDKTGVDNTHDSYDHFGPLNLNDDDDETTALTSTTNIRPNHIINHSTRINERIPSGYFDDEEGERDSRMEREKKERNFKELLRSQFNIEKFSSRDNLYESVVWQRKEQSARGREEGEKLKKAVMQIKGDRRELEVIGEVEKKKVYLYMSHYGVDLDLRSGRLVPTEGFMIAGRKQGEEKEGDEDDEEGEVFLYYNKLKGYYAALDVLNWDS